MVAPGGYGARPAPADLRPAAGGRSPLAGGVAGGPFGVLSPAGNKALAGLFQAQAAGGPAPAAGQPTTAGAAPATAPATEAATGAATAEPAVGDGFDALATARPIDRAEAKAMLDRYEALTPDDRDALVHRFHQIGVMASGLQRLLAAVDPAELKARRALLTDIAERVQRLTVEGLTGKTLAELGAEQGAFMVAVAEAEARANAAKAAASTGAAPRPVQAHDIAATHDEQTRRTSPIKATVVNAWDALDPATQAAWNSRAAAVIGRVVAACGRLAPELGITAANLKWNPREVAQDGSNVFAFSGDPISFGMSFIETAEANPDYVVRVVVHEIVGHPDFGARRGSYEAKVYAEAHRQVPTLGSPWDTMAELSTFGYIGTETYAALREVPYDVPLRPEHAARGLSTAIEPASNIDNKIGLLKAKYAPAMAGALLQGLYERFKVDPRVSQDALALFERIAARHFPGALTGVPERGPRTTVEAGLGAGVERGGDGSAAVARLDVRLATRWADTALSAGLRVDLPFDRASILRVGLAGGVETRLFHSLYGELHAGYTWAVTPGTSGGATAGAGVSVDFGSVQLGVVYDFLRSASEQDADTHQALLRLGFRFGGH